MTTIKSLSQASQESKNLIGRVAENYNQDQGYIIDSCLARDYETLDKYDQSGWLNAKMFDEYNLIDTSILVAFRFFSGEIAVYTFEMGGVELIEEMKNVKIINI